MAALHLSRGLAATAIVLAAAGAARADDLLGLAETTLDNAIHSPVSVSQSLGLGSFANVGVTVGGKLLADSDLTPEMKESNAAFIAAGKGTPIWIRQEYQGGPTISWAASMPVVPQASLSLYYGFAVGTTVDYLCEDQYPAPAGITDSQAIWNLFEAVPQRTIDLPLSTPKALAMVEGTHRVLTGTGSLVIYGGLSAGARLYQLGVLQATSGIDASASLQVTWSISDSLRCEVTREAGSQIRVHWSNSASTSFGPSASVVVGLTVDPSAIDAASSLAGTGLVQQADGQVVSALVNDTTKYTRISFGWSQSLSASHSLDANLLFDLSNPAAAPLFEAAVRGNISPAQQLGAAGTASGVLQCTVTSSLTDADSTAVSGTLFSLLDYSYSSTSSKVTVDVKNESGSDTLSNVWSYAESTTHMFVNGTDTLTASATDTVATPLGGAPRHGTRVDMHETHVLGSAQGSDMTSDLKLVVVLFGSAAVVPDMNAFLPENDWDPYGNEQLDLNVSLGPLAQDRILSIDQNTFLKIYGTTFYDVDYSWTPDRVNRLQNPTSDDAAGWVDDQTAKDAWDAEAQGLAEGLAMYGKIEAAAAGDASARLAVFTDLAQADGYNRRVLVACALIGQGLDVEYEVKLTGAKASFDHVSGTVPALPSAP
jgi:hypothetical protein